MSLARSILGAAALLSILSSFPARSFESGEPGEPREPREMLELALRSRIHSHNDYQQKHPLWDALDQGLSSVEADIWIKHGQLLVSHMGWTWSFKGSLEDLYLKPLQALIDKRGSVYGDGRPFILWIDIKENQAALENELERTLLKYPMLTEFTDDDVKQGPVTVILTGKAGPKIFYADHSAVRHACRDSKIYNDLDPLADRRWLWYSLKWSSWMNDPVQLAALVSKIHAKGRKVRFWDVPTSEAVWRESLKAGADLVGADDLPRVRAFLDKLGNE